MHAKQLDHTSAAASKTAAQPTSVVVTRARANRGPRVRAAWSSGICALLLCECGGGTGESANPLPNQATIVLGGRTATPAKPEAAPVLVAAPQPLVVADGEPAMFIVVAQGAGLQYRWFVNGATVFGVSGPVLQLHAAMRADDGAHVSVMVSNDAGQFATPTVRLSVEPAGWRAPWS